MWSIVSIALLVGVALSTPNMTLSQTLDELNASQKLQASNYNVKNFHPDNQATDVVERPLFIGSYNIQTLGKRKLRDDDVMITVERVVHRYDLILILELMTNDSKLLEKLLRNVNNFAPEGVQYNMTVSIDPVVNEFCAVFYRIDRLRLLKSESYSDPQTFYRRPFFVKFASPTLRDMKEFGIIGYHVKPSQAVKEINGLADVYDFMKRTYKVEDILLMGDFNADCTYVGEKDWENIALWMRPEFTWAIGHHVDTTTNHRSCALDRIVYAGENMNAGVIMSSAQAFDFREAFDIRLEEARAVSDHWPIEIKIRGKMSVVAERHLTSDVCFSIQDSRMPNISKDEILSAAKFAHFSATVTKSSFYLHNETKYFDHMLDAMQKLRKLIPNAITREQLEGVIYKTNHGALDDPSSYADEPDTIFKLDLSVSKNSSKILVCRSSTIN